MSTRKLLTNGNAFKRTDNRWGGVVWYMDEQGERKRKSFSGTTKAEVNKKMTEYIAVFNDSIIESQETKKMDLCQYFGHKKLNFSPSITYAERIIS